MENTSVTTVRTMIKKSEEIGYNRALNDVMVEARLKIDVGFIIDDKLLTEIINNLIEKLNNETEQ